VTRDGRPASTSAVAADLPAPAPLPFGAGLARAVHAFPGLLRVGIADVVAYRAEFLVWILTTNMPLVMLALWHAVAADGPVGRFGQAEFTSYFLGVLAVRLLTSNWAAWQMSMEIRDGTLSAKLLRPVHPIYAYAAEHLAAVPMRAVVVSPIVALLFTTSWKSLLGHDARLAPILVAALLGAWLLTFFMMVLLGSLAFFIDSSIGVFELWIGVYSIFSGYLIPLEAMTSAPTGQWVGRWILAAAEVLPFRFMLAFPVEVLVGLLTPAQAVHLLAAQWLYVVAAFVGALSVWRAGVRRFSAFGG
jgi:ABC-2 type transport system permease protein